MPIAFWTASVDEHLQKLGAESFDRFQRCVFPKQSVTCGYWKTLDRRVNNLDKEVTHYSPWRPDSEMTQSSCLSSVTLPMLPASLAVLLLFYPPHSSYGNGLLRLHGSFVKMQPTSFLEGFLINH